MMQGYGYCRMGHRVLRVRGQKGTGTTGPGPKGYGYGYGDSEMEIPVPVPESPWVALPRTRAGF